MFPLKPVPVRQAKLLSLWLINHPVVVVVDAVVGGCVRGFQQLDGRHNLVRRARELTRPVPVVVDERHVVVVRRVILLIILGKDVRHPVHSVVDRSRQVVLRHIAVVVKADVHAAVIPLTVVDDLGDKKQEILGVRTSVRKHPDVQFQSQGETLVQQGVVVCVRHPVVVQIVVSHGEENFFVRRELAYQSLARVGINGPGTWPPSVAVLVLRPAFRQRAGGH